MDPQTFKSLAESLSLAIDGAGAVVIVVGMAWALARGLRALHRAPVPGLDPYRRLRQDVGRAILLGLEFMVAGDIIRTVAVEPTLDSVIVLGAIVLIRTFLSVSLEVELEGRWPWRPAPARETPPR